jgi:hypothetical protein
MDKKFAVIGAGQLGSRHLQALGKVGGRNEIFIVDPSADSRRVALERFHGFNPDFAGQVAALESPQQLPAELDVAIVATTSNVRLTALKALLQAARFGNLVLEKVLFQDLAHYQEAAVLLQGQMQRTWVNCPQRLWPFFRELRERFGGQSDLEVVAHGSNWGLGCNAIHNADIAAYLWSGALRHQAHLDPVLHDSKRPGFKEFTGELVSRATGGGQVRQVSWANGSAPFRFSALHPTAHLIWDVATGSVMEANTGSNWDWTRREIRAPYQSELTTRIVEDILAGRDCGLPDYKSAANLHMGVLQALLDGARSNGIDLGNTCPVT